MRACANQTTSPTVSVLTGHSSVATAGLSFASSRARPRRPLHDQPAVRPNDIDPTLPRSPRIAIEQDRAAVGQRRLFQLALPAVSLHRKRVNGAAELAPNLRRSPGRPPRERRSMLASGFIWPAPVSTAGQPRVRSPAGNRFRVHAAWHQGQSIRMLPTLGRRGAGLHAATRDSGIVIRHAATLIALEDI